MEKSDHKYFSILSDGYWNLLMIKAVLLIEIGALSAVEIFRWVFKMTNPIAVISPSSAT